MNTDRHLKNELSELAAERNARKIKELREGSTEKPIDWQKVRIQAAIAAMQGMLSNDCSVQSVMDMSEKVHRLPSDILATMAVSQADALVKELKGE